MKEIEEKLLDYLLDEGISQDEPIKNCLPVVESFNILNL